MSEQFSSSFTQGAPALSYPIDLDEGRGRLDRVFFGVMLEEGSANQTVKVARRHQADRRLTGNLLPTDHRHSTLCHVGDFRRGSDNLPSDAFNSAVAMATWVGNRVTAPAFPVSFNWAASFEGRPGNHPYVLLGDEDGVAGLEDLHRRIGLGLVRAGHWPTLPPEFTPHVTLFYDRRQKGPIRIDPISWIVREFVLVHSHVGETRYEFLARWRLED